MNRKLSWINTKLGDVLDQILGGGTPSKTVAEYWDNGNIPWATVKDMAEGKYTLYDTKDHITEAGVKNSATRIIPKGTVIISTRMGLGRCFINKVDMAINQDLKALIPKKDLVDTKFLLWLYASKAQTVDNLGTGTTVKGIRIEQLKNVDICLPPLPTQRKIAAILSAYDDLIENNTRRIRILEEMAQLIYREWFVKFRFPGHEKVRMVDSELGPIPEGWEIHLVSDVAKRLKVAVKYTQSNVLPMGNIPVIDQSTKEVLGYHNNAPDYSASSDNPIIIFGDHTCKMQLMVKPFSVGPNVVPFVSKNGVPVYFLYYAISNLVETREYKRHWNDLMVKKILIPTSTLMQKFSSIVIPIFQSKDNLRSKNTILRQTRDLLLPKLISGELDVEDLDIAVGGD